MSTKINKHGVKSPVVPRKVAVKAHDGRGSRALPETVAEKATKHRAAFEKLAKT